MFSISITLLFLFLVFLVATTNFSFLDFFSSNAIAGSNTSSAKEDNFSTLVVSSFSKDNSGSLTKAPINNIIYPVITINTELESLYIIKNDTKTHRDINNTLLIIFLFSLIFLIIILPPKSALYYTI